MRAIEAACVERGFTLDALMHRAGSAVAQAAHRLAEGRPILVLAGPGNNGGDGLVAASQLLTSGSSVTVHTFRRTNTMGFSGTVVPAEEDSELTRLRALLREAGVVVDALLGIGQNRPPEGLLNSILRLWADARGPDSVGLSVDIPTGVDADTGQVWGTAFSADLTLCMGLLKCGAIVFPGAGHAGKVEVADVGIPSDLTTDVGILVPDAHDVAAMLPRRSQNSNKGTYGRVLVVAGSRDFMGAPGLVSIAALRAGAGLAEVASTPEVCRNVAAHALEPIYLPLEGRDGHIPEGTMWSLRQVFERVTALVFGPGLGSSEDVKAVASGLLYALEQDNAPPAVIDADGLNALSKLERWWERRGRIILTPHPGEMSRLTGIPTSEIQRNRLSVARDHAARWKHTVVLKGAGTIVAHPDGRVAVNTTGSGNLATGGTGDVLSGVIGGLLAQGCDTWQAAVAGTYLHGRAGDMLAEETGMSGTLAGDLPARIPLARRAILASAGVSGA
jgi:NAD(P)H-hydrate epimerase